MLNIEGMESGIVIDHIKVGAGFFIFEYLGLDKADYTVTLIRNARSEKLGRKDVIKIENVIDLDLAALGFIDPEITVNIIEKGRIKEKIDLFLPNKVEDIIKCKNPRCITSIEKDIVHSFFLVDKEEAIFRCKYCDHIYSWEGYKGE